MFQRMVIAGTSHDMQIVQYRNLQSFGQCAKDAEFISFRVGHHNPCCFLIIALANFYLCSTESLESGNFCRLVLWPEIKVQSFGSLPRHSDFYQ